MKGFKAIIFISLIILYLTSCKQQSGRDYELTGVKDRPRWFEPEPTGMRFIPGGSFNMGQNDQDVPMTFNTQTKTVTVDAFWMDETEITNNEYRQFVNWVRDSIAMRLCVMNADQAGDGDGTLKELFCIQKKGKKAKESDNLAGGPGAGLEDNKPCNLNWDNRKKLWDPKLASKVQPAIEELYYNEQDRIMGRKEIDKRKLVFEFYFEDLFQAAKYENRFHYDTSSFMLEDQQTPRFNSKSGSGLPTGKYDGHIVKYNYMGLGKKVPFTKRRDVIQHMKVPVYPDTLVWIRDYTYSYNEPIARKYFWHPAFDDYPVVGVTWWQAFAFSHWRTKIMEDWAKINNQPPFEEYRLPTEAEWEYAARGGLPSAIYPWGSPYTRNNLGCFLANFKPLRGRYGVDLGIRTIKVATYEPNDFGLYDMAGNVAEWTIDAYDESAYSYTHDLNPTIQYFASKNDPISRTRKVVRGGSWKDIGYYLQCGVRTYEYADSAKSYIGFRNVRSYLGQGIPEAAQ